MSLSGRRRILNPIQLVAAVAGSEDARATAPTELQILRIGKFRHPLGDFEITRSFLEQMVANYNRKVHGQELAFDYDHMPGPAPCWPRKLRLSDEGTELFASDLKWTPSGRKAVEDEEYRYTSSEFYFDYPDSESGQTHGPTLVGVALTNRPFVKRMQPATQLSEEDEYDMDKVTELSNQVAKLSNDFAEQGKRLTALEAEKAALAKQVTDRDATIKALENEKDAAAKLAEKSAKEAQFTALLAEGKAVPAQKDAFMKGDMVEFVKLAGKVNLGGGKGSSGGSGEGEKGSAEDKVHELAEKALADKRAPSYAKAVSLVLSENRELRERYHAEDPMADSA